MAERKEEERDAERWRFVRDRLARAVNIRMDGTSEWRFVPLYVRAATAEEAVDKAIEQQRARKAELEQRRHGDG